MIIPNIPFTKYLTFVQKVAQNHSSGSGPPLGWFKDGPRVMYKPLCGWQQKRGKKGKVFIFGSNSVNMPRTNAFGNRKKQGLQPNQGGQKATFPKTNLEKSWAAGGQAPAGKPSRDLSKATLKYLRAIHKRDGVKLKD